MRIALNGFEVDARLARLMSRADWWGRRTDDAWLDRFPGHPSCEFSRSRFVEFCNLDQLARENTGARNPDLAILWGQPRADYPPGDFDPTAGYMIGFTDVADAAICVDLRPEAGPRIIYDNLASEQAIYATAFDSIASFVQFYIDRHGGEPLSAL
jgi:hypothetical protein